MRSFSLSPILRAAACLAASLAICVVWVAPSAAAAPAGRLQAFPSSITLETSRDRQSVLATLTADDGVTRDVTAAATWSLADPTLAALDGRTLRPLKDGQTVLRVTLAGQSQDVPLVVHNASADRPISFKLDVMPVFMASGCNTGACHGSARGKDGFRLSLFGFDPDGDYYRLTRELATRRLNLAQPADSLLLLKATGAVPHTGGKRFGPDSAYYATLMRWLEAGAPQDPPTVAKPVAVELLPHSLVLEGEPAAKSADKSADKPQPGDKQQLLVMATYSDGTVRDVTSLAVFMTNNDNSAMVTPGGMVTAVKRGEAFLMARFATFTVATQAIVIPRGLNFEFPPLAENNYVDTLVNAKLKKLRIAPSELCSDEEFLRRVYVDIAGQLPKRADYERFTANADAKKREKLVDELLERKEFVELWVMKFAELLQIRSDNGGGDGISYKAALRYYSWLDDRLSHNVPMDQVVRELLSASGGTFTNPATNYYQITTDNLKMAENTAQVFMGVRTQCAQCHNHPFDRWTQDDYYGFAAFFSQVGRKKGEDPRETIIANSGGGEVKHLLTMQPVPPKFLGGPAPDAKGKDRRQLLADWLTSPQNPYFAKNLANIVWSHFFGRGVVDPVDDVRVSNPAVNPELLEKLGEQFKSYHYDFKKLVRDICTSRTYQLSTVANATNEFDTTNFSHAMVRRLRAEVLLDCIDEVTETKDKFKGLPAGSRAVQIVDGATSTFFLTTFGRATRETVCSCEVSMQPNLSQALHMLNGETVHGKVNTGGVVARLLTEKVPRDQIIADLYLRCFSRKPTAREVEGINKLLGPAGQDKTQEKQELEDLFWALLNSKEFLFNH